MTEPKMRMTRREKRIIRKGSQLVVDKANVNPYMAFPIAYALQHGYEVVRDDGKILVLKKPNSDNLFAWDIDALLGKKDEDSAVEEDEE